jgi:hypothetical protein
MALRHDIRRGALLMDRSEYIKRCVLKDMLSGGSMEIAAMDPSFTAGSAHDSRSAPRKKPKKG